MPESQSARDLRCQADKDASLISSMTFGEQKFSCSNHVLSRSIFALRPVSGIFLCAYVIGGPSSNSDTIRSSEIISHFKGEKSPTMFFNVER